MDGRAFLESMSSTGNGEALQKLFSLKHVDGALDTSIVGVSDEKLLEFQAGLVRVKNLGATPAEIGDYVNAITQDKVQIAEGSRTYLDNVIDDNDLVKFRSDLFEAKTAAGYGTESDTVRLIIQALGDRVDIGVVKADGKTIYIECKRPNIELTAQKIVGFWNDAETKFESDAAINGMKSGDKAELDIDAGNGLNGIDPNNIDSLNAMVKYVNDNMPYYHGSRNSVGVIKIVNIKNINPITLLKQTDNSFALGI